MRLERLISNLGYCSRSEVSMLVRQRRLTLTDGTTPKASAQVRCQAVLS
jgi:16S rRNA U516 pseudouridylate synthase RsuA-like enzyme